MRRGRRALPLRGTAAITIMTAPFVRPVSFAPFAALAAAGLLGAATARAQAPDTFRFVPDDAQVVLRIAAPARWVEAFAGTRVAKLLASDAVAPLLADARHAIDGLLAQVQQHSGLDPELLLGFWNGYRGEIVVGAHFDEAGLSPERLDDGWPFTVSIAFTPDPGFDLGPLTEAVTRALEKVASRPLGDVVLGEHRLRGTRDELAPAVTLPARIDGHTVLLLGDVERQGARMLERATRKAPVAGPVAPLSLHADLRPLRNALGLLVEHAGETNATPIDIVMLRDFGFRALESLSLAVAPAGEHTVLTAEVATGAEDRGLFDLFAPSTDPRRLLRRLPAAADAWWSLPLDVRALYALVERTWKQLGDDVPMSFDDAIAAANGALKIRLEEDLIDHLGTGVLQIQDVDEAMDLEAMVDAMADNPIGATNNGCYVVSLRDGKAFGAALETALRARGLHAARKTEEYQGTKVHRLRIAGFVQLEYAVTDDLLLVASGHGESAGRLLRGVLDTGAAGGGAELPAAVTAHAAAVPKDWTAFSSTPLARTLLNVGRMVAALEELGESMTDGKFDDLLKRVASLAPALERHGLGTYSAASWFEARRIVFRCVW